MKQEPAVLNLQFCVDATKRIADVFNELGRAEKKLEGKDHLPSTKYARHDLDRMRRDMKYDLQVERRLEVCRCIRCYYRSRMAGASVTQRPCGLCGDLMQFGSTASDVICKPCATLHELCAHCGGDITGDTSRNEYPESQT